ncbi:MAG: prolyl oligopeptidase family serine peptidase, partial [Propionibacteriaceae bacterium]|nr:prolyl oligopeptidase family serine peptidase [Propionibacteriaceae bacterium]
MQEHFPEQPVIPAQVGYRVGFDEFLDGYYDPSDQLREWVYESTRRRLDAGQSSLDAVDTVDGLDQRVAAMRRLLLESFGGGVRPAAPLIVTESPRVCDGGQVAAVELVVTGRTGLAIPATVYEPGSRTAPGDAVLILCGHAPEAREYGPFVQLARSLARAGILAVVADPIAQGGRRWHDWEASAQACLAPVDRVLETHNELGVRGWWAGVSLQRYFAEDAMTMVDYLVSRPDVDPARIGVTGSSGGGVQAALLMMLDPRIAAAAPANFISSRRAYLGAGSAQDGEQIFPTLSAAGFDHADILAAMAPRPVLVAAGNYDFFPVEGAIATVERARRLYSLHGAADRLHLVRTDAGHGYNTELIDAVTGFFKANLPANCPPPGPRRAVAVTVGQATRPGADEADRLGELLSEDFPGVDPDVDAARAWLAERISQSRQPLAALYPRWTVARRLEGTRARSIAAREFHWSEQGILNAG